MWQTWCCDARDGLAALPDNCVDLIVTDPPYRGISGGNAVGKDGLGRYGRPTGMLTKNDGKYFRHNDIDVTEYAAHLYRVLTSPGHCYVMSNLINLWRFHEEFTRVGFKVHNLLVWHKNTTNPNRWFMKNGEYILFLRKGPARSIYTPGAQTVTKVKNVTGTQRQHPTEKPVELMQQYVLASSLPGQVILDPFMGAGSTGVAALREGRRFIGFESDLQHYTAAYGRLTQHGEAIRQDDARGTARR